MKRLTLFAAATIGLFTLADAGGQAFAQQPAPPGAAIDQPPGGRPAPRGDARQRPPGPPGGARRNPGIVPGFPPGFDPSGRGRNAPLPPGHPVVGGGAAVQEEAPSHGAAHGGHCPGHGPMDSLAEHAHINWWQGLLGVDNEKAKSANALDRLLWRYKNTHDECDTANQEPPVLAQVINLGILLLVFAKFGKKPLADALAKRKQGIVEDMMAAKALGDEAEERLAEYEDQLENLDERRQEVEEESAAQWEAEKARILAEAEERRVRMRKDAEFRVQQERKSAQQELLREAIEGATEAARELLAKRLDATDHDRLADEYLASVATVVRDGASVGGAS